MNNVLFSKKSDNWKTPKKLYNYFINLGYYDPCPFNSEIDSLKTEWKEKNFVNPPYSKIKEFVNKSIEEHKKGKEVVLLIPCRTDTLYFRKLLDYGIDIILITGRLHFNDSGSAPFPSCLITLTGKETIFKWINRQEDW